MTIKSDNGFTFTAATDAAGTRVTLVAHKDDHEGRKTEVFPLAPEQVAALAALLSDTAATAKQRRKAIRKANVVAPQDRPQET